MFLYVRLKTNENFLNVINMRLFNSPIYLDPEVAVIQSAVAMVRRQEVLLLLRCLLSRPSPAAALCASCDISGTRRKVISLKEKPNFPLSLWILIKQKQSYF